MYSAFFSGNQSLRIRPRSTRKIESDEQNQLQLPRNGCRASVRRRISSYLCGHTWGCPRASGRPRLGLEVEAAWTSRGSAPTEQRRRPHCCERTAVRVSAGTPDKLAVWSMKAQQPLCWSGAKGGRFGKTTTSADLACSLGSRPKIWKPPYSDRTEQSVLSVEHISYCVAHCVHVYLRVLYLSADGSASVSGKASRLADPMEEALLPMFWHSQDTGTQWRHPFSRLYGTLPG
jgi:hypothetical protein